MIRQKPAIKAFLFYIEEERYMFKEFDITVKMHTLFAHGLHPYDAG
jgi:hypothetical protein